MLFYYLAHQPTPKFFLTQWLVLQVTGHGKKISVKQVVKDLIREDGWKGVYRGFCPRLISTSAWGTSMVLAYEYLSKNSCSLIS